MRDLKKTIFKRQLYLKFLEEYACNIFSLYGEYEAPKLDNINPRGSRLKEFENKMLGFKKTYIEVSHILNSSNVVLKWGEVDKIKKAITSAINTVPDKNLLIAISRDLLIQIRTKLDKMAYNTHNKAHGDSFEGTLEQSSYFNMNDDIKLLHCFQSSFEAYSSCQTLIDSKACLKELLVETSTSQVKKNKNYFALFEAISKYSDQEDQTHYINIKKKETVTEFEILDPNKHIVVDFTEVSDTAEKSSLQVLKNLSKNNSTSFNQECIEGLKLLNWNSKVQLIHKLLQNLYTVDLNLLWFCHSENVKHKKMTPSFCKSLCQFIRAKVKKQLILCNFAMTTAQLKAILAASMHLECIRVYNNTIVDKSVLSMPKCQLVSDCRVKPDVRCLSSLTLSNNGIHSLNIGSFVQNLPLDNMILIDISGNFKEEVEDKYKFELSHENPSLIFNDEFI